MRPTRTLSAPGGRRGGLARYAGAVAAPAPVFQAPPPTRAPALNLGTLQRVAWTVPFTAFMLYIISVMTNRFSVAVFAVPVAALGALVQGRPLRWGSMVPMMALFLGWCALGATISLYPDLTSKALIDYAKLVLIVFAGVNALWSLNHIRVYLAVILVSYLAYPAKGAIANYLAGSMRQGRAAWSGVYGNPNDLAAISILVLSIALSLLAYRLPRWARLATFAASGITGFVILITQSRGAFIAVFLFGVAVLWRSTGRERMRMLAGGAAIAVALVAYAPEGVWRRLSSIGQFTTTENLSVDSSADQRFEIWKVALGVVGDHPLFGAGLGTYGRAHAQVAARPQYRVTARGERDTHSTYLNVLAETGPVGLALFLTVIVLTLRHVQRVRRQAAPTAPADARALLTLQIGFAAYLIAGIWGSYGKLHMPYLHLLLMWTMAEAVRRDLDARARGLAPAPRAR